MRDLSLHILDLIQNSVEAGAKNVTLTINEDRSDNLLTFIVEDDGCGMDENMVKKVRSPFTTNRTTRKVGLGLPLIDMTTQMAGGSMDIDSKPGRGTIIKAMYLYDHIDRPPLGDIATTIKIIAVSYQQIRFYYKHIKNNNEFILDTKEMREILGEDIDFGQLEISQWLDEYLKNGLEGLERTEGSHEIT